MDERDVIFARMRYQSGNLDYEDYYKRKPEKKEIDEYLRSLPGLCSPDAKWFNNMHHPFVDMGFKMIGEMAALDNEEIKSEAIQLDKKETTSFIKEIIEKMGGRAKIIKATPELFYDIKGRPLTKYNLKVDKSYKNIIVFSMPMDLDYINDAPKPKQMLATILQYMQGANISIYLSKFLNSLGYRSKAQFDGSYDLVLPLVADKAGLGQLGYLGILIDEFYGPRVRLGAILTDADLILDEVVKLDFREKVCQHCNLCVDRCIVKAIKKDTNQVVEHEKCHELWRKLGNDCAYCIKVCPFTQPIYQEYHDKLNNEDSIKEFIAEHIKRMNESKINK